MIQCAMYRNPPRDRRRRKVAHREQRPPDIPPPTHPHARVLSKYGNVASSVSSAIWRSGRLFIPRYRSPRSVGFVSLLCIYPHSRLFAPGIYSAIPIPPKSYAPALWFASWFVLQGCVFRLLFHHRYLDRPDFATCRGPAISYPLHGSLSPVSLLLPLRHCVSWIYLLIAISRPRSISATRSCVAGGNSSSVYPRASPILGDALLSPPLPRSAIAIRFLLTPRFPPFFFGLCDVLWLRSRLPCCPPFLSRFSPPLRCDASSLLSSSPLFVLL